MKTDNRHSLWLALQFFTSLILSLVGLKINLLTFGDDLFSIWLLLLSVWGVGTALDLGFGLSIVRFIAKRKEDKVASSKIVSTSFILFLAVGVVIFLISLIVGEVLYFSNHKLIPEAVENNARLVFILLGGNFYFQYITIVFRSTLEGHNEYLIPSKISLMYSCLIFCAIISTYLFRLSLPYLAFFYLVSSGIQLLMYLYHFKKSYSFIRISIRNYEKEVIKRIASFSISIQVTFFIGSLIDPVVKYIIGTSHARTMIPTYEIAKKFSNAVSGLYNSSFRNSLPRVSVLKSREDFRKFLYTRGVLVSRFGITYSALFFGVFSFLFAIVFKYFYNNESSLVIFYILALAESVNNVSYIFYMFIIGQGKALFLSLLQTINLTITATCVASGFYFLNTNMGFTGLFVASVSANVLMLMYVKKMSSIKLFVIYAKMKIWKLIVLITALFLMVFAINEYPKLWVLHNAGLILVCSIVFYRDIKVIAEYILREILRIPKLQRGINNNI